MTLLSKLSALTGPDREVDVADLIKRLRGIPVWMVRDMRPGWQTQGAAAYQAADLLMACIPYLKDGETPAQRIERDIADNEALCQLLARERSK